MYSLYTQTKNKASVFCNINHMTFITIQSLSPEYKNEKKKLKIYTQRESEYQNLSIFILKISEYKQL